MTSAWRQIVKDIPFNKHMTAAHPDLQAKLDATPAGMFTWASSGPAGCVCFGCAFFARTDNPRKPEVPQRCGRWAAWYRGAYASRTAPRLYVPPTTPACSAYVARPEKPIEEMPEDRPADDPDLLGGAE